MYKTVGTIGFAKVFYVTAFGFVFVGIGVSDKATKSEVQPTIFSWHWDSTFEKPDSSLRVEVILENRQIYDTCMCGSIDYVCVSVCVCVRALSK